ncbi:3-hydroxyacyl-[acyl-carrier-protein] dehydratase FabZ [wastewater metagenome]|uniref:3-hydroxyacyl-[acyl-carrier-protein] dehydratase n=2 Tax=unclassified sequences TaxID=12908 RepID=A0A5B8R7G8_9ZZZZ|nr:MULTISPECIES: 3-hydroxyacyl-ACP dehydratase FabZ [Arhodomonas]MCS4505651.1 3-hydroxyacyl-ACP dehydratase FabZ [Arhodomonas aquaeolei]QEA04636.1 3-hydroxyacyl-[acyl-carrier-protein] dehydratase FabZ [uncultured organism]
MTHSDTAAGMDCHEIKNYLPHRYPFLLVDRVRECVPGESIEAIKNVTVNEPFFQGHFPQRAVMPGVLILEALAQACGLLAFRTQQVTPDDSKLFYLVGIDKAKFKRPVEPGDCLTLEARFNRNMRGIWMFAVEARVDGAVAASAEIRCTMREV